MLCAILELPTTLHSESEECTQYIELILSTSVHECVKYFKTNTTPHHPHHHSPYHSPPHITHHHHHSPHHSPPPLPISLPTTTTPHITHRYHSPPPPHITHHHSHITHHHHSPHHSPTPPLPTSLTHHHHSPHHSPTPPLPTSLTHHHSSLHHHHHTCTCIHTTGGTLWLITGLINHFNPMVTNGGPSNLTHENSTNERLSTTAFHCIERKG